MIQMTLSLHFEKFWSKHIVQSYCKGPVASMESSASPDSKNFSDAFLSGYQFLGDSTMTDWSLGQGVVIIPYPWGFWAL